jgi:hypothetical protein
VWVQDQMLAGGASAAALEAALSRARRRENLQ